MLSLPNFLPHSTRTRHSFLSNLSEREYQNLVAGLGYYRRFRNMRLAAQNLCAGHHHESTIRWPESAEEWRELPGIGPYTSAAIASIALNESA